MRTFSALYNSNTELWSVIFKDPEDKEWSVFIDNADSQGVAHEVADALSARELREEGSII